MKQAVIVLSLLVLILTALLVFGRTCRQPNKTSLWGKDYCNSDRLDFQEVTDTAVTIKSQDARGGLMVNGKPVLNSSSFSLEEIKAHLNGGGRVLINQKTSQVIKVSPQFWEDFTRNRKALCDLVDGINNGILGDEEKKRAANLYFELIKNFGTTDEILTVQDLDLKATYKDITGVEHHFNIDQYTTLETFKDHDGNWLDITFELDKDATQKIQVFSFRFGRRFVHRLGSNRANVVGWDVVSEGGGQFKYWTDNISNKLTFQILYKAS